MELGAWGFFSPILSSGDYQGFCPLQSTRVTSCPLLSHSYWPQRNCRKNPCYDGHMKGSPHACLGLTRNLNLHLTLNLNRSPAVSHASSAHAFPPLMIPVRVNSCSFVVEIQNRTKPNKTERKCQGPPNRTGWPSPSTLGPRRSACGWAPSRLRVALLRQKCGQNTDKMRTKSQL